MVPIVVECVSPDVQGGRYPAKRLVGDRLEVGADIFKDGHDLLAARVRFERPDGESGTVPMTYDSDRDRWFGSFTLDRLGRWSFTVEAWTDRFGTWRAGLEKKIAANVDVALELREGAALVDATARRARDAAEKVTLRAAALTLRDETAALTARGEVATSDALRRTFDANYAPDDLTSFAYPLEVVVDRRARGLRRRGTSSFPRSQRPDAGQARHLRRRRARSCRASRSSASTSCTCRRSIRSGARTARGRTTRSTPAPDDVGSPVGDRQRARRAHRDRSRARHARRLRPLRRSGATSSGSRSRSTTRCSARPTIRG